MNRNELKELIQGPIATVPTAFDADYQLDLDTMTELTSWWVESGLVKGTTVIKVAAAMGEGPDLSDDEWPQLLRTVVNAADGRAAIVCGLKTKNTLHTIEDAKRAQDLGAIGVQIDLPIFHHPVQDDMVRFFTDISDQIDIGIMVYNTWWFNHPSLGDLSLSPDSILRLADAEHVVGIKWSVPPGDEYDYDDMRRFSHIFNVIDNSNQAVRAHKNGARGYITSTLQAYPPHDLKLWELLEAERYDEAQALIDRVSGPLAAFGARSSRRSGGYRLPKALMEVMGRPVGPPRPPTLPLDDEELAELREIVAGLGWPVARPTALV